MTTQQDAETMSRIGVVGGGLMGSGIAEVCAAARCDVVVREIDDAACAVARHRVEASLARAVKASKVSGTDRDAIFDRIRFTTELDELGDRDLVIEAIVEDELAKAEVFAQLDKVVEADDAVFASNTSSIPIMKLAMATSRPHAVLGLHFFNPVPILRLVELIPSLLTAPEVAARAEQFATVTLRKRVIRSQDRAGFVVNSLLVPYMLSAMRMLESGFATKEDIDTGMVEGCNHPMGPLALADLVGLDTVNAVAESLYDEFKEPLYAPPPLLSRMVDAGLLGRKSKRGFYEYQ